MAGNKSKFWLRAVAAISVCLLSLTVWFITDWRSDRNRVAGLQQARERLSSELAAQGFSLGTPVFMRIFKQSHELEVWLRSADGGRWRHFKTYKICNYSGTLGPKLKEGDRQSPEGLYSVGLGQLHPGSRYHLAFNLGFPNAYDRALGRTGSFLMVHGDCVSIGCYAMTDAGIEEIYALAEAALENGQDSFWVHAFPARLTDAWIDAKVASPWIHFWRDLKVCYDRFEHEGRPPNVEIAEKRYRCA